MRLCGQDKSPLSTLHGMERASKQASKRHSGWCFRFGAGGLVPGWQLILSAFRPSRGGDGVPVGRCDGIECG